MSVHVLGSLPLRLAPLFLKLLSVDTVSQSNIKMPLIDAHFNSTGVIVVVTV